MIKIWSVKNPLFGGVLLASVLSQAAVAAELPLSQAASTPEIVTPEIVTPDQAVRRMATKTVADSRAAAVLSISAKPITPARITPLRPISKTLPLNSGVSDPSQVLSSCPANVCGFTATQPPVNLGTVSAAGISKTEQNKLIDFNSSKTSAPIAYAAQPQTSTPNDQITSAAKISLSTEPGLSKDIAFGQSAAKTEKTASKFDSQPTIYQPDTTPTVARVNASEKSIGIGNVQNQITSFTGQLVANSWKLITVLPKPQLDPSLLNIGSSGSLLQPTSLSFSPRFTLGTAINSASPKKVNGSWSASSLFMSEQPAAKSMPLVIQWNKAGFLDKPLNGFPPDKLSTYKGFSSFNRFEVSTKTFSIVNFLATVNTSTLSSNKFGSQNY
jgi:hypothetical protein